jgi:peptide/nickel transport system permease protein
VKRWRLVPVAVLAAIALVGRACSGDASTLVPARALAAPSLQHPLGFGEGGIDLLAAVGAGVLGSLALAVFASAAGLVVGVLLGAFAGYRGGMAERALSRALDTVQALPSFFVALALLTAVREPNRMHLALVFSATAWAPYARLAMAQTRVLRGSAFVEAARALGRSDASTVLVHVLPQLGPLAVVQFGASAAAVVLGETGLSFLGFVALSGAPSLGRLLEQGVTTMLVAPHVLVAAAGAVLFTNAALLLATGGSGARAH